MRSPADMRIIQIELTNACTHQCSNCTRFCGHHQKPFFMSMETFERAVDSLEGYQGCIGMMGGEPTLHPNFAQMAKYLSQKHPSKHKLQDTRKPIVDFARYIYDKNYMLDESLNHRCGPGLWTSMVTPYYKHYELIQDIFSFQNINDHQNESLHQPLLVSRKDLGIPDEEWYPLRDKCWIQNMWSASITPKGAFFCEIAAALDMLFDGPGGWKIEPGWWKRTPEEFGDQLHWCELCGAALFQKGRLSYEEIDDVSPTLYEMLKKIHSKKVETGRVHILTSAANDEGKEMTEKKNRYLTDHLARMSKKNRALYPKAFDTVALYDFDKTNTVWGVLLNRTIKDSQQDWMVLVPENSKQDIANQLIERLKETILNPGVCYEYQGIYVFHPYAQALRDAGFDGIAHATDLQTFLSFWAEDKRVSLAEDFDVYQNPDLEQWKAYAKEMHIDQDPQVSKCLQKIESDYREV